MGGAGVRFSGSACVPYSSKTGTAKTVESKGRAPTKGTRNRIRVRVKWNRLIRDCRIKISAWTGTYNLHNPERRVLITAPLTLWAFLFPLAPFGVSGPIEIHILSHHFTPNKTKRENHAKRLYQNSLGRKTSCNQISPATIRAGRGYRRYRPFPCLPRLTGRRGGAGGSTRTGRPRGRRRGPGARTRNGGGGGRAGRWRRSGARPGRRAGPGAAARGRGGAGR